MLTDVTQCIVAARRNILMDWALSALGVTEKNAKVGPTLVGVIRAALRDVPVVTTHG